MYCSDFFPNKPKTAKYAGNWDPKSKTLDILQQKYFFNKNMQVLIYGGMEWTNKTVNPFTASYYEEEKKPLNSKKRFQRTRFRRTLVKGKNQCMQYKSRS
jgi:hypothetical protein